MKVLFFSLMFASVFIYCERDKSPTQPNLTRPDAIPVILIENPDDFDRAAVEKNWFRINNVYTSENFLIYHIQYGGGCKTHEFQLFSTEGIYFSNPPQADLFLSHENNGDMCEALVPDTLVFDLTPLRERGYQRLGLRIYEYEKQEPYEILWW